MRESAGRRQRDPGLRGGTVCSEGPPRKNKQRKRMRNGSCPLRGRHYDCCLTELSSLFPLTGTTSFSSKSQVWNRRFRKVSRLAQHQENWSLVRQDMNLDLSDLKCVFSTGLHTKISAAGEEVYVFQKEGATGAKEGR